MSKRTTLLRRKIRQHGKGIAESLAVLCGYRATKQAGTLPMRDEKKRRLLAHIAARG